MLFKIPQSSIWVSLRSLHILKNYGQPCWSRLEVYWGPPKEVREHRPVSTHVDGAIACGARTGIIYRFFECSITITHDSLWRNPVSVAGNLGTTIYYGYLTYMANILNTMTKMFIFPSGESITALQLDQIVGKDALFPQSVIHAEECSTYSPKQTYHTVKLVKDWRHESLFLIWPVAILGKLIQR